MKLCELCTMCKHEERTNCVFRPYEVLSKDKIHGIDNHFITQLECQDFEHKDELKQRKNYLI